jgi:hypothetical protein
LPKNDAKYSLDDPRVSELLAHVDVSGGIPKAALVENRIPAPQPSDGNAPKSGRGKNTENTDEPALQIATGAKKLAPSSYGGRNN